MRNRIIHFFLNTPVAVLVLVALVLVGGWISFSNLTVEAFPDPTDPQVNVITLYEGQSSEEVERRVSLPLERALNGTPNMVVLRSANLFGLSFITLTFDDKVDILSARQQVMERLSGVTLPDGVQPSLGPLATPIGEVYRYTIEGADPMTLRTLEDWVIEPHIRQVQGVADVTGFGGFVREVHVVPRPQDMAAQGITLDDIFTALKGASSNATGGYVERGQETFVIRSLGTFQQETDLDSIRVGYHDDVPVLLRTVADVQRGFAPRQGVVSSDHNQDAVLGIILMRRGGNPSVVLQGVRDMVKHLNEQILPCTERATDGTCLKKVQVVPFYDRTDLVHTTLHTVGHNMLEGALLVTLVIFVFMLSIRASLVVALVIPFALASSFIYLYLRGMSANLLSMGSIDFGIIVDGAVILVEYLYHRIGQNPPKDHETLRDRVFQSTCDVAKPTMVSVLIITAAYVPIFTLQRVEGRIFGPMANALVSALIGAFVAAFLAVPLLTFLSLKSVKKPLKESPLVRAFRAIYTPALRGTMRNPLFVVVIAVGALIATGKLLPNLGSEFLPELNEGALWATFELPLNASITEGRRMTPKILDILKKTPEVTATLSQLGRPEDGTDWKLPSNIEVFIRLKPPDQWRPQMKTLTDIIAEMSKNLEALPGLEINFSQPIRDNVEENISGQKGKVSLKIYGEDLDKMFLDAEKAEQAIEKVPGAADVGIVKAGEIPQVAVKIRRDALARFNLDLNDVQNYIETAMGGHVASDYWDGEKKFDVTVRLPSATREDVGAIRRLQVPLKDGTLVPLSALADVNMSIGRAAITRENGRRYIGVRMNVRNRDLGSFVAEAQKAVATAIPSCKNDAEVRNAAIACLPDGYETTWGGEFENQQRAMKRLAVVVPLTLVITFVLLFTAFGTIWESLLILCNAPFALIGGVVALAVAHMTLSVAAAVGFITLIGQSTLEGVLVVSAIKNRIRAGQDIYHATVSGAQERMRPVIMTAMLASLGMLPAALSHAIGSETQRPIAVVVVGGTITAALLSLIWLPLTYYWITRVRLRLLGPKALPKK